MKKQKIGQLSTGLPVYDRPDSHLRPEIANHIRDALALVTPETQRGHLRGGSYTVTLPGASLPLYRVVVAPSDQLYLARRQGRVGGRTVFVARGPGLTDQITMVLGFKDRGQVLRDRALLVTAFSGTPAQREPWDRWYISGRNPQEREYRLHLQQTESVAFWTSEALVLDPQVFPLATDPEPFDLNNPTQMQRWIKGC